MRRDALLEFASLCLEAEQEETALLLGFVATLVDGLRDVSVDAGYADEDAEHRVAGDLGVVLENVAAHGCPPGGWEAGS